MKLSMRYKFSLINVAREIHFMEYAVFERVRVNKL